MDGLRAVQLTVPVPATLSDDAARNREMWVCILIQGNQRPNNTVARRLAVYFFILLWRASNNLRALSASAAAAAVAWI